jgi:predicted transcriptional regulator
MFENGLDCRTRMLFWVFGRGGQDMSSEEQINRFRVSEVTVELVGEYVSKNRVRTADLPDLIVSVHASLSGLGKPQAPAAPEKVRPAVPIKKSITPDYLISLEDGRRYKSLRRHLGVRGLTPEQYRTKWGLPADYPIVAPSYAKRRSELAKSMGLGRKRVEPEPVVVVAPAKRGRPKNAA